MTNYTKFVRVVHKRHLLLAVALAGLHVVISILASVGESPGRASFQVAMA